MKYPDDHILLERLNRILKTCQYFLIPGLKCKEVARELGIPVYRLTKLLQSQTGCNFNDYVNRLRVDFACRMMSDASSRNMPFTDLAQYSGFASRSVFYDAFKKAKGFNPGEFKVP